MGLRTLIVNYNNSGHLNEAINYIETDVISMKAFELTRKQNLKEMSSDQRQFTAKMIVREVQKIAKAHNISEEEAYWGYTHGLYGADRNVEEENSNGNKK